MTILYNEYTLFASQLSSVQIPTASAAHLTDLIKYFIYPSTFFPLTKLDTLLFKLFYMNRVTWSLWFPIEKNWKQNYPKKRYENFYRTGESYETYLPRNDI